MKTTYQLRNFKAFRDTGTLELAPITILCGENSIGKSSILKSLLLLRQSTAERRSRLARNAPTQPFLFNGELTRLGSWSDTVHRKARSEQIGMSWSASGNTAEIPEINRFYPWRRLQPSTSFDINLEVSLRSTDKEVEEFSTVLASASLRDGQQHLKFCESEKSTSDYDGTYVCSVSTFSRLVMDYNVRIYSYSNPSLREVVSIIRQCPGPISTGELHLELEGPFPTSVLPLLNSSWIPLLDFVISNANSSRSGVRGPKPGWLSDLDKSVRQYKKATQSSAEDRIESSTQDLAVSLIRLVCSSLDYRLAFATGALSPMWKKLRYLGPLRYQPQRFYQFDDTGGVDIGVSGEFTVQVLALESNNVSEVSAIAMGSDGHISLITPRSRSLLDATNDWLEVMGLPPVHPNVLQQSLYELRVGSLEVALPDVGFGVSQVLPIVVEALRSSKGDTIILEQPEIHLHPRVQAALADFFIARANDGIKFIVESHSEYLVKRLCRRISEGTFPNISDLINLVFVEKGVEGEAVCTQVQLNEFGEIENWPAGFFDTHEDLYWTEAALRRRRNNSRIGQTRIKT